MSRVVDADLAEPSCRITRVFVTFPDGIWAVEADTSVDHVWPYAVGLNAGLVNTVLLHSLGHRNYSNCPFAQ